MIYFNDVICKAWQLRTRAGSNSTDAHDSVIPNADSLSTKLKHIVKKQKGQYFVSRTNTKKYLENVI